MIKWHIDEDDKFWPVTLNCPVVETLQFVNVEQAAIALAQAGVDLCISARGEARLLATARELEAFGVKVTPVVTDHSTDVGRAAILAACPAPDILVGTCSLS